VKWKSERLLQDLLCKLFSLNAQFFSFTIIKPRKPPGKLVIECNELWSFVDRKKNEVYIWLAIDRNSRKIVGCFVGDRTRESAHKQELYLEKSFGSCRWLWNKFLAQHNETYETTGKSVI